MHNTNFTPCWLPVAEQGCGQEGGEVLESKASTWLLCWHAMWASYTHSSAEGWSMLPVQLVSVNILVCDLRGSGNLTAPWPWCLKCGSKQLMCMHSVAAQKMAPREPDSFFQLAWKQATNFTGSWMHISEGKIWPEAFGQNWHFAEREVGKKSKCGKLSSNESLLSSLNSTMAIDELKKNQDGVSSWIYSGLNGQPLAFFSEETLE